ncbi:hypothetical protein M0813_03693 [Anaeramoeba flamelloides]|uniref:Uncharacterized protein n=1 Tax=Anaeramoeba flamelloides TaxID=1746091 RepID=A0ABQ8XSJ5_9EUKA|nr:hypothetical protein M0813_03693 [Anaeramoeba flamelloides]
MGNKQPRKNDLEINNNPIESKILEQYQNRSITSLSKEEKKEIQDELWLKFCESEFEKGGDSFSWKILVVRNFSAQSDLINSYVGKPRGKGYLGTLGIDFVKYFF